LFLLIDDVLQRSRQILEIDMVGISRCAYRSCLCLNSHHSYQVRTTVVIFAQFLHHLFFSVDPEGEFIDGSKYFLLCDLVEKEIDFSEVVDVCLAYESKSLEIVLA